jgi:polysaccharide deacetylase family protein (PEP-CTERM system associated)
MKNILSIDLEDWYQLAHRHITGELIPPSEGVFRQLDLFLEILAESGARATFFTVGMLAERYPELVRRIAAAGHEVACHGYAHLIVYRLTPDEFRSDTSRAKKELEDITGRQVRGYRAAEFSIRKQTLWALDVLAELGFDYDSSIFPIRHRRYGIVGFERAPRRYDVNGGRSIVELPPSTLQFGSTRVPVAGGGYFRLMPLAAVIASVERLNRAGLPLITYFHPYEFDNEALNIFRTLQGGTSRQRLRARLFNFHQNLRRTTMASKLAVLLSQFEFTTCLEYLNEIGALKSRGLFSAHGG